MTYSFRCNSCNKKFELHISMSQYMLMKRFYCPYCESHLVVRVMQPVYVIYKGPGFYSTDDAEGKNELSSSGVD